MRHDNTVGIDGRRKGRGWRRAGRRASHRLSGKARSGARGESVSSTRRISWCPGPWLSSLIKPSRTDMGRHGRRPDPSKCCPRCASCSAGWTCSMSPARTSATNHSRSTTLRGVGIVCPTPARCTGSCRVTMVSTTPTRTCGASPDTKNPLGSAPFWDRLERRDGFLRIRGPQRAQRDGRGGRSRSFRGCENKYPCQVARHTLGYTKVSYCGIAKGRMHIRLMLYKHE